jgi:cbb3-type cytochrome oxidase cytochrome c subunit
VKGLIPLFLGIFGTFAFSWTGLILIPNLQIGHLDPQMEEDGSDVYPAPRSGMAERGRRVYAANGCNYCHTQQVRADYAGSDIERKWGERRSAPRDYIFDRPVLLGKMRMGPDLANVGHRTPATDQNAPPPSATTSTTTGAPIAGASPAASPAASPGPSPAAAVSPAPASQTTSAPPAAAQSPTPSPSPAAPNEVVTAINGVPLPYTEAWHHRHLYNPRSITVDSDMPAFRFLYQKRQVAGQTSADALIFDPSSSDAPPMGWEIVPSYDARCLVAYLMSLDQSHPLKEVKAAAAPVASPAASAAPAK